MFIVGTIIWYLLKTLQPNLSAVNQKGNDFFTSVLLTFLIWEGNLFLDRKISKYFLWTEKPLIRVVVQAIINIIYNSAYSITIKSKSFLRTHIRRTDRTKNK